MLVDIKTITQGRIGTNSYVVSENQFAVFIDPEGEVATFIQYINEQKLIPLAILLTHGHFDHIGAVEALRSLYEIPVYAGENEKELLASANLNLSAMMYDNLSINADYYVKDHDCIKLSNIEVQVLETPGHTIGSVCYIVQDHIFSGDTLFFESYGRFDFPTGNKMALYNSVKRLLALPNDYIVHAGHGEETTLAHEKKYNPFAL